MRLITVIAGKQYDITTLDGDIPLSVGDYIIKGMNGELCLCKQEIFEQIYEEIE